MKTIITFLAILNLAGCVSAQKKNRASLNVNALFNDMPFAGAAKNSILNENENPQVKIHQNIFVVASVNKTQCFLGEPILLSYHLYSALQSTSTISTLPTLFGFTSAEIATDNQKPEIKKMHGKSYRLFIVQQYQLIPFQKGKLNIGALSLDNSVSYKGGDHKINEYSGVVNSNDLNIEVQPLPVKGQPAGFSGAVGKFRFINSVRYSTISATENNTLHIEISGKGNFTSISLPEIKWPESFEYFPVKEYDSIQTNVFPSEGKKIFEVPFISKKEGHFVIPSFSFVYFDASKKTYQTIKSYPVEINVLKPLPKPEIIQQPVIERKTTSSPFNFWTAFIIAVIVITGLVFILTWKRKTRKTNKRAIETSGRRRRT